MNVIVVGYMGFDGPGVMHAHHFANGLVGEGHEVLVLVNGDKRTVGLMTDPPRYRLEQVGFKHGLLTRRLHKLATRFAPHIVHIWTPRHVPARVGLEIAVETGAGLVIHFEDDEEFVLRHFGGNSRFAVDDVELYRLLSKDALDTDKLTELAPTVRVDFLRATAADPGLWPWLHPIASAVAVRFADAFTVISQPYKEALERDHGKSSLLLYPGVDRDRFRSRPTGHDLRDRLGLQNRTVLVYSGAISDIHDFPAYLRALPAVVREHPNVMLVQIGRNDIAETTDSLIKELCLRDHVLLVGGVPHHQMPDYLSMADVFLAPVRHDDFNKHRLPSKIPEYMSVGRPMVVMDWGFGRVLETRDGVLKVNSDGAGEIARGLLELFDLRDEWPHMGNRLRKKAAALFDWSRNTKLLTEFYGQVLERHPADLLEGLEGFDAAYTLEAVGFSTATEASSKSHSSSRGGTRVLLLSDAVDVSAVSSRFRQFAQSLSRVCDVALGLRSAGPPIEGVELIQWSENDRSEVLTKIETADLILIHGHVLDRFPELQHFRGRRVVDAFNDFLPQTPTSVESRISSEQSDVFRFLRDKVEWGEFFVCATERQRSWVLGVLTAMRRLDPISRVDASPDDFVALVPQGIPETPAKTGPKNTRSRFPGIQEDDVLLVWGGSMGDSSDPVSVIRGLAVLADEHPEIKLLFTGGPGGGGRKHSEWAEAKAEATVTGLAGRSVFFAEADTDDHTERGTWLSGADIGVCSHFVTLQTYLSFNAELLDYIDMGLPVLTSRGDFFATLVEEQGLGRAVKVNDPDSWAEAIRTLATNPQKREACRRRAIETRKNWTWCQVVKPLLALCLDDAPSRPAHLENSRALSVSEHGTSVSNGGFTVEKRDGVARDTTAVENALREEVNRLKMHATELEHRYEKILQKLRIAEMQIGLLRKIPFVSRVWRIIRRWKYPGLKR